MRARTAGRSLGSDEAGCSCGSLHSEAGIAGRDTFRGFSPDVKARRGTEPPPWVLDAHGSSRIALCPRGPDMSSGRGVEEGVEGSTVAPLRYHAEAMVARSLRTYLLAIETGAVCLVLGTHLRAANLDA